MTWTSHVITCLLWAALVGGALCRTADILHREKRQSNIKACGIADIVFVLDSSGSIGRDNWVRVLDFVRSVIQDLDIGYDATRVGVVTYGNRAEVNFDLKTYTEKNELLDAVSRIRWKDEETNTSGAIWTMREKMFTVEGGDRSAAPNLGIVITDGESNRDHGNTIPYAEDAKRAGITMFAIGIGDNVNDTELSGIASNNSVYKVGDFQQLTSSLKLKIVGAACDIPVQCTNNADIVFILDASGSVREENFVKTKDFVKQMVDSINVDRLGSNLAVVTFSDDARIHFRLSDYNNRVDMIRAIDAIPYTRGTTNTASALRLVRQQVFREQDGDRPDLRNIAILMTDGGSNDFSETLKEARLAREAGITMISVGIKDWVNMVEIREIASDPDDRNVFSIESFDVINRIQSDLKAIICNQGYECESNPCQNGGRCVNGVNRYTCKCPRNYAGANCEYRKL